MKRNGLFSREVALMLTGAMTLTMVGCGNSAKQNTGSPSGVSEAAKTSSNATSETGSKTSGSGGGKQKLVIWSWGADDEKKSREKVVEDFEKAHPDIEVEHSVIPTADHVWDQKMTAALAAGTGPDVIQMSPDYYGLYTDYYEDLKPYVDKDGTDLSTVITDGMLAPYYRPDGKLEGMPLLENTFVLAYNKDLFDKCGVSYPTADWTWDDVAAAAKKFVSGKGADATYGIVNHWIDPQFALICKGGAAYSDDLKTCQLNSQEVKDGLSLFAGLVQSGAMPDDTAAKSLPKEQLFVSGHAAMYPLGGFETKLIADEVGSNFKWDVAPIPKVSGNGKNNILFATGYAMLKTSKNKDAAWTFLKEMSYANDDMAKDTCTVGLTANKKVAESYYKGIKNGPIDNSAYLESLSNAKLNIWGGAFSAPGDVWTQIWQSVTIDKKTPDEAMKEYYPSLEKAFNDAVNK